MKRFAVCTVLSVTSFASFAQAQEMPAAYKQVLDTLGKTGDFKRQRPQGEQSQERSVHHGRERQDPHAVWLRWLGGPDQRHRRHGRDDGGSRADAGRG